MANPLKNESPVGNITPTQSSTERDPEIKPTATRATYISAEAADLTQEHRDYLLQRHGTLDIDPIPTIGDADPYNWPKWKVCIFIFLSSQ